MASDDIRTSAKFGFQTTNNNNNNNFATESIQDYYSEAPHLSSSSWSLAAGNEQLMMDIEQKAELLAQIQIQIQTQTQTQAQTQTETASGDGGISSHLLLLFALLVLINLIVILGNILVILAVYLTAKLRSVTNIFIVSLATADLLLGLLVLPYALTFEILDVWVFGQTWCRGWLVTDVWISTASILNLCAISVDRYVAVTRPVKYRSIMTPRKAKTIVAGVWIVSFLICFPPLLPQWNPSSSFEISSSLNSTNSNSSSSSYFSSSRIERDKSAELLLVASEEEDGQKRHLPTLTTSGQQQQQQHLQVAAPSDVITLKFADASSGIGNTKQLQGQIRFDFPATKQQQQQQQQRLDPIEFPNAKAGDRSHRRRRRSSQELDDGRKAASIEESTGRQPATVSVDDGQKESEQLLLVGFRNHTQPLVAFAEVANVSKGGANNNNNNNIKRVETQTNGLEEEKEKGGNDNDINVDAASKAKQYTGRSTETAKFRRSLRGTKTRGGAITTTSGAADHGNEILARKIKPGRRRRELREEAAAAAEGGARCKSLPDSATRPPIILLLQANANAALTEQQTKVGRGRTTSKNGLFAAAAAAKTIVLIRFRLQETKRNQNKSLFSKPTRTSGDSDNGHSTTASHRSTSKSESESKSKSTLAEQDDNAREIGGKNPLIPTKAIIVIDNKLCGPQKQLMSKLQRLDDDDDELECISIVMSIASSATKTKSSTAIDEKEEAEDKVSLESANPLRANTEKENHTKPSEGGHLKQQAEKRQKKKEKEKEQEEEEEEPNTDGEQISSLKMNASFAFDPLWLARELEAFATTKSRRKGSADGGCRRFIVLKPSNRKEQQQQQQTWRPIKVVAAAEPLRQSLMKSSSSKFLLLLLIRQPEESILGGDPKDSTPTPAVATEQSLRKLLLMSLHQQQRPEEEEEEEEAEEFGRFGFEFWEQAKVGNKGASAGSFASFGSASESGGSLGSERLTLHLGPHEDEDDDDDEFGTADDDLEQPPEASLEPNTTASDRIMYYTASGCKLALEAIGLLNGCPLSCSQCNITASSSIAVEEEFTAQQASNSSAPLQPACFSVSVVVLVDYHQQQQQQQQRSSRSLTEEREGEGEEEQLKRNKDDQVDQDHNQDQDQDSFVRLNKLFGFSFGSPKTFSSSSSSSSVELEGVGWPAGKQPPNYEQISEPHLRLCFFTPSGQSSSGGKKFAINYEGIRKSETFAADLIAIAIEKSSLHQPNRSGGRASSESGGHEAEKREEEEEEVSAHCICLAEHSFPPNELLWLKCCASSLLLVSETSKLNLKPSSGSGNGDGGGGNPKGLPVPVVTTGTGLPNVIRGGKDIDYYARKSQQLQTSPRACRLCAAIIKIDDDGDDDDDEKRGEHNDKAHKRRPKRTTRSSYRPEPKPKPNKVALGLLLVAYCQDSCGQTNHTNSSQEKSPAEILNGGLATPTPSRRKPTVSATNELSAAAATTTTTMADKRRLRQRIKRQTTIEQFEESKRLSLGQPESTSTTSTQEANKPSAKQRKKSGCALFDDKSYVIYSSLGSFYIPMLIMIFFYSRIYLVASRAHKAMQRGYMTTKSWPPSKQSGCGNKNSSPSATCRVAAGGGGQCHHHQRYTSRNCPKGSANKCSGGASHKGENGPLDLSNGLLAVGGCTNGGGGGSDNNCSGPERVTLRIHRREKSPSAATNEESTQTNVSQITTGGGESSSAPADQERPSRISGSQRQQGKQKQKLDYESSGGMSPSTVPPRPSALMKLTVLEQQQALRVVSVTASAAAAAAAEVVQPEVPQTKLEKEDKEGQNEVEVEINGVEVEEDSKKVEEDFSADQQNQHESKEIGSADENSSHRHHHHHHHHRHHHSRNHHRHHKRHHSHDHERRNDDNRHNHHNHHHHGHHHHHNHNHHHSQKSERPNQTPARPATDCSCSSWRQKKFGQTTTRNNSSTLVSSRQSSAEQTLEGGESKAGDCRVESSSSVALTGVELMHSSIAEEEACANTKFDGSAGELERGTKLLESAEGSHFSAARNLAPPSEQLCYANDQSSNEDFNSVQITVSQFEEVAGTAAAARRRRRTSSIALVAKSDIKEQEEESSPIFVAITPPLSLDKGDHENGEEEEVVCSNGSNQLESSQLAATEKQKKQDLEWQQRQTLDLDCEVSEWQRSQSVDIGTTSSIVVNGTTPLLLDAKVNQTTSQRAKQTLSLLTAAVTDDDDKQFMRIDRSHSCGPTETPAIVVNWNPETGRIGSQLSGGCSGVAKNKRVVASEHTLLLASAASDLTATAQNNLPSAAKGEGGGGRRVLAGQQASVGGGSQGSGLSIMASLPSQVRKQSMMLLSTITTRSSQTLRRLSMVASHPVESLLHGGSHHRKAAADDDYTSTSSSGESSSGSESGDDDSSSSISGRSDSSTSGSEREGDTNNDYTDCDNNQLQVSGPGPGTGTGTGTGAGGEGQGGENSLQKASLRKRRRKKRGKDKRRRRRRHHRHRQAKSARRSPLSMGSKRTLDDYLMAVAGIDGSSDDDEQEELEDDDDDDEEDEDEDDEDNDGLPASKSVSALLIKNKESILFPGVAPRISAELSIEDAATEEEQQKKINEVEGQEDIQLKEPSESPPVNNNSNNNLKPSVGLHRQGAYYERATSRTGGVVETLNQTSEKTATLASKVVSVLRNGPIAVAAGRRLPSPSLPTTIATIMPEMSTMPLATTTATAVLASRNNTTTTTTTTVAINGKNVGNLGKSSQVAGGGEAVAAPRRRGLKRTSRWHAKRLRAETKAAKTVAIIVGGFIFCWLPFFTAYLSRAIICEKPDCIPQSLLSVFIWLGYLNSAINPVIYGLFSADFRHAFKNIVCRCRFRNTDDTVVVSVLVDSIIKSIL